MSSASDVPWISSSLPLAAEPVAWEPGFEPKVLVSPSASIQPTVPSAVLQKFVFFSDAVPTLICCVLAWIAESPTYWPPPT
jgi:hypothetical protein